MTGLMLCGQCWSNLTKYISDLLALPYGPYLLSLTLALVTYLVQKIFFMVVIGWLGKLAQKTKNELDDQLLEAAKKPLGFFCLVSGLYIAVLVLPLSAGTFKVLHKVYLVLITLTGGVALLKFSRVISDHLQALAIKRESKLEQQMVPLLAKLMRLAVYVVTMILLLENLGYSTSGLVAGMGLGGLAFALAAKDMLSNLFGSVMIFADKPFMVGDYVELADGTSGTVEEVGFRSTKIRNRSKTLITVPNSKIAGARVENYSRRPQRRVSLTLTLTYDTTSRQIKAIIADIKKLLTEHPNVDEGFSVYFANIGEISLDISIVFQTKTPDWEAYKATMEFINISLLEIVEQHGADFAFPSRTIYQASSASVPGGRKWQLPQEEREAYLRVFAPAEPASLASDSSTAVEQQRTPESSSDHQSSQGRTAPATTSSSPGTTSSPAEQTTPASRPSNPTAEQSPADVQEQAEDSDQDNTSNKTTEQPLPSQSLQTDSPESESKSKNEAEQKSTAHKAKNEAEQKSTKSKRKRKKKKKGR